MYTKEHAMELLKATEVYSEPVESIRGISKRYKHIIRKYDNQEIAILGKDYQIFQNTDALNKVTNSLDEVGIRHNIRNITTNMTDKKNRCKITLELPDLIFDVDGSPTIGTVEILNAQDGSMRFTNMLGAFRLVCLNGVIIGTPIFNQTQKHTKNFAPIRLSDAIYQYADEFDNFKIMIEKSQEKKVSEEFIKMLIKSGLPARVINNLPKLFEKYIYMNQEIITNYQTIWAYYAVLTNWITHEVAKKDIKRAVIMNNILINNINKEIN